MWKTLWELEKMDHWKTWGVLSKHVECLQIGGSLKIYWPNESSSDGYFPGPYFCHTIDIVCNDNYYVNYVVLKVSNLNSDVLFFKMGCRLQALYNLYCGRTPDQTTLFDHSFWNVSSWALPNAGFESCSSAVHSLWKAGNLQYLQRKRNKCWNSWWVCGFNLFQMHVKLEIFPYHHLKRAIPTFILLIRKREIHHTRIQPDRFFLGGLVEICYHLGILLETVRVLILTWMRGCLV